MKNAFFNNGVQIDCFHEFLELHSWFEVRIESVIAFFMIMNNLLVFRADGNKKNPYHFNNKYS